MGINLSGLLSFLLGLVLLFLTATLAAPVAVHSRNNETLSTEGDSVWTMCTVLLQHIFQVLHMGACALVRILLLRLQVPAPFESVEKRLERSTVVVLNTLGVSECVVLYVLAFICLWSNPQFLAFGVLLRLLFQAAASPQRVFHDGQELIQRPAEQTLYQGPISEQSEPAFNEGTVLPLSNQSIHVQGHQNNPVLLDVENDDSGSESDSSAKAVSTTQTDINIEELTCKMAALPTRAYSAWAKEVRTPILSCITCS